MEGAMGGKCKVTLTHGSSTYSEQIFRFKGTAGFALTVRYENHLHNFLARAKQVTA